MDGYGSIAPSCSDRHDGDRSHAVTQDVERREQLVLGSSVLCRPLRSRGPRALPGCKNTKPRLLVTLGFSGAEIRCKITPMKYGYARVSTDGTIFITL
jgi:hypothetical protein